VADPDMTTPREDLITAPPKPEEKLPQNFDCEVAKGALDSHKLVYGAFTWDSTPQGHCFWNDYHHNRLSPEDMSRAREALRRWIEIAEREASK